MAKGKTADNIAVDIRITHVKNGYIVYVTAESYLEDDVNGTYVFESIKALLEFTESTFSEAEEKS